MSLSQSLRQAYAPHPVIETRLPAATYEPGRSLVEWPIAAVRGSVSLASRMRDADELKPAAEFNHGGAGATDGGSDHNRTPAGTALSKHAAPAERENPPPAGLVVTDDAPPEPRPDRAGLEDQGKCLAEASVARSLPASRPDAREGGPAAFGLALATAAREQTADFVVYRDRYQSIAYPMGDVPALFGVCTDVVVRAYRAMGIDLQTLVHEARIGTGDPSIDHRRTETLRRFLGRNGETLPVTGYPEDYLPGDIVTYHRPHSRGAQSHIAIVSDVVALSGRPMIVHNRGWGPQLEDALFVDTMTGHYRFTGAGRPASQRLASGPASQGAAGKP